MPIYEYSCSACGERTDMLHGRNDPTPTFCALCGAEGTLRKAFAPPTILFKGSGWAKKDRSSARSGARPVGASADGASDGKSEKSEKSEKSDGSDRHEKSAGSDRHEGSDSADRSERSDRSEKSDAGAADPAGSGGRPPEPSPKSGDGSGSGSSASNKAASSGSGSASGGEG